MNPSGPGVSRVVLLGFLVQATPFGTVIPPGGVEIYPVPRSISGDRPVDPAPDAVVEGVVLDSTTSRPIGGARVTLTPVALDPFVGAVPRPGDAYLGVSDSDGRFVIEAVRGLYDVSADAEGFVRGSERILHAGVSLEVGQRFENRAVLLTPGAAVTGTVRDENGDPVGGAVVSALRESFRRGRRTLGPCDAPRPRGGASQTTDERGQYRLFDLTPGRYYVSAQSGGVACESPAYYPGVVDSVLASPIRVIAGGEVSGIDVVTPQDARYGVQFEILDRSGMSGARSRTVRIVRRGLDGVESSVLLGSAEDTLRPIGANRFATLPVLPPGSYGLYVNDAVSVGSVSAGRLELEIRDQDVDAGVMVIPPPVPIQGVVRSAEGTLPASDEPLHVVLEPLEGWHGSILLYWFGLDASGEFSGEGNAPRITGVAEGRYRVRMTGLEPDTYLSSIRYDGEDVSGRGYVELSADRAEGLIELVVDTPGGALEGVVRDGQDAPVGGSRAVVVPLGAHRGNIGRFRSVFADPSGRFVVRGLPPGDYGVLAWERVPDDAWLRAEFMRPLETRMERVHVEKGDVESIDVRMIARDD